MTTSTSKLFESPPETAGNYAAALLAPYLDAAGLSAPTEQVLVVAPPLPRLPLVLAIFTHSRLARLAWSTPLAALTEPKGRLSDDSIDGVPLVCGIACILRQFHQSATQEYVDCLMQLLRALIHTAFSGSSSAKIAG